jgi:hypothetical protein
MLFSSFVIASRTAGIFPPLTVVMCCSADVRRRMLAAGGDRTHIKKCFSEVLLKAIASSGRVNGPSAPSSGQDCS